MYNTLELAFFILYVGGKLLAIFTISLLIHGAIYQLTGFSLFNTLKKAMLKELKK